MPVRLYVVPNGGSPPFGHDRVPFGATTGSPPSTMPRVTGWSQKHRSIEAGVNRKIFSVTAPRVKGWLNTSVLFSSVTRSKRPQSFHMAESAGTVSVRSPESKMPAAAISGVTTCRLTPHTDGTGSAQMRPLPPHSACLGSGAPDVGLTQAHP